MASLPCNYLAKPDIITKQESSGARRVRVRLTRLSSDALPISSVTAALSPRVLGCKPLHLNCTCASRSLDRAKWPLAEMWASHPGSSIDAVALISWAQFMLVRYRLIPAIGTVLLFTFRLSQAPAPAAASAIDRSIFESTIIR